MRVCLRHGWLGSHRVNDSQAVEPNGGTGKWQRLMDGRRDLDLDLPYGPKAVELGLAHGSMTPAERARTPHAGPPRDDLPPGTDLDAIPF